MIKHAKKFLSITLVLILSMIPQVGVSAATLTVIGVNQTSEAIKVPLVESAYDLDYLDSLIEYQVELPSDTKEMTIPITLTSKGVLDLYMYHDLLDSYMNSSSESIDDTTDYDALIAKIPKNDIRFSLYSDEACTSLVNQSTVEYDSDYDVYEPYMVVPKAGTYYLKIKMLNDYTGTEKLLYDFSLFQYSGENRTLVDSDMTLGASIDENPIYYKVKADKDGYFTLSAYDYDYFYTGNTINIKLCDSNKKAISKSIDVSETYGYAVFAVKKGIYYLSVTTTTDSNYCLYALGSSFTGVTENSGSKKSTAKKISTGKTVKGLQTVQSNNADWYKTTTTKNSKMTIELNKTMTSGNMKLAIYDKNNKKLTYNSYEKDDKVTYTTSSKLKPGTYYIKIEKSNQDTSGYYTLKVK